MRRQCSIVFLCFGDEGFFYECAFALLSLSRFYPSGLPVGWEICIYTDKPGWFSRFKNCPLLLQFRAVDERLLASWKGDNGYLYRTKITMLLDYCRDLNKNVLYLDTDIVVTFSLEQFWQGLDNGALWMHSPEGRPNDKASPILRKLKRYFAKKGIQEINGRSAGELLTWNSGVLGFNGSNRALLQKALDFVDLHYKRENPIRTLEQVAFSVVFGAECKINAAEPFFLHYWNLKEVRKLLAGFFNYFEEYEWVHLVEMATHIQMYGLLLNKTRFAYNRTLLQAITGKRWQPWKMDWESINRNIQ